MAGVSCGEERIGVPAVIARCVAVAHSRTVTETAPQRSRYDIISRDDGDGSARSC